MDGSWQSGMMLGLQADALTKTVVDSDYIDDFLLDSSWLEATDVSEFLGATLNNVDTSAAATSQSRNDQGNQLSLFLEKLAASESEGCDDWAGFSGRGNDKRKLHTGPRLQNQSSACSVRDRLTGAVGCIRDLIDDEDSLVQIWVPMEEMGRRVLTTHDQPFALDGGSQRLANYRDVSTIYQFPAEEESGDFSKVITSMPGRVFLAQVPEWSPDVQLFTSDEYSRVDHARKYNVRGTLAVPVFEQMSEACLGVIEIVTTRQGIKYQSELEKVSKALEGVDLRSCGAPISQNITADMAAYEAALPEIKQVLKTACETHDLPLAQTWIPCTIRHHPDENCPQHCVSTVEEACVTRNPKVKGFLEACSEQHLLKGQGVVGRALVTNEPCFSSDITRYSKEEYPLSSHARVFGLCGAVAIRLRSVITGEADFVLEFFLPGDCRTPDEQHKMLNSLSVVVGEACQTLRVVTDEELECEKAMDFWDQKGNEEGWKLGKPVVERKRTKSERKISLEILRQHFAGTLKDAAISLGVCSTTLKRICRQHGITRWPSRKLKKVGHSLKKLQVVMDSVEGTSGSLHINSFYTNFPNLDSNPREPTPSIIITQPDQDTSGAKPTSSPSSCSQSSASSAEPVRSPAGEEQGNVVVSKISSNRVQRVKVAYGDEIVRFRISSSWGYEDLLVEIGRRFGIEEMKRFDVKYLDDDSEWVLLTCDEDFEECVEVCHSSLNQTVKLLLQVSSRGSSD